jgi:hypothetical protein
MLTRKPTMLSHKPTKFAAVAAAVIAIGGGAYGIVTATASTTSGTASAATSPLSASGAQPVRGGGGSNARSGPAAGGSVGTVDRTSASGFTLTTSAGQKVTVKVTASTAYWQGAKAVPASGVTTGESVLVLGTTNSTTITASRVVVQPTPTVPKPSSAGTVVPFTRGAQSASQQAGQIPATYTQGAGTIVSGTAANKATRAALAVYPGGIVDRVVKLSNGEYEAHYIGVNWPHHIFVNQDYQVVGAN